MPINVGTPLPSIDTSALNLPSIDANTVTAQGANNQFSNLTTEQKIDILFGRS
jgi:hypothetical protein